MSNSSNWNDKTANTDDDYAQSAQGRQSPQQNPSVHPNRFIYLSPNSYHQYFVECEKISNNFDIQLLNTIKENVIQLKKNEYIFFYQQGYNHHIYQVSCEIVAPFFINNCLNKNHYGIEIEQNVGQKLVFTDDQEKNLELHLSQYLNNYLLN